MGRSDRRQARGPGSLTGLTGSDGGRTAGGSANRTVGWAWVGLTGALGLHVTDEALSDFLAVYNPAVARIRSAAPFLPLPTFTFATWLGGLAIVVLGLALVSPFVLQGRAWTRPAAIVYGTLMALNGMVHAVGSLHSGRVLPGTYSAPLLLAAALVLVCASVRAGRSRGGGP